MEYTDVVIIPVIIALIELLKVSGVPAKVLPIASITFGVVAGAVYVYPADLKAGVLIGLIMGLSASGLYSGAKTLIKK